MFEVIPTAEVPKAIEAAKTGRCVACYADALGNGFYCPACDPPIQVIADLMEYGAPLQLTTGCICREAADWYPGQPPNPACLFHHRCNVALLSRSRHQEGMGWRCPRCRAGWTLTRIQEPAPPARLYPTMGWVRDTAEGR